MKRCHSRLFKLSQLLKDANAELYEPIIFKPLFQFLMLEAAISLSPRMSLVWLLVLLVGTASAQFPSPSANSDYCRFSGKHTMCRYKGVAPECSHHHDREDILTRSPR